MSQWFRMYTEVLNDPKAQRLPGDVFKGWINLLCLAKEHDGVLPPVDDIAFALRISVKDAAKLLETLRAAGLFDQTETGLAPHNWNGRQYKSDVSTTRVKRFRERNVKQRDAVTGNGERNVSPPLHATPPDTDSESEQSSVPNGTGAAAPPKPDDPDPPSRRANGQNDPVKALFDLGVSILSAGGTSERQARSLVGKWRKELSDDERLVGLFLQARKQSAVEPVAWLTRAVAGEFQRKRYGSGYVPPGVGG